jgi:hypothetical protein
MKGIETVDRERIVINSKEIKFDYPVEIIEVSESKIFVCLDVYDTIKFGKQSIFCGSGSDIKKFVVNNNKKPEYRETSRDVEGDNLNRVYCYDYKGKLVWQMQSAVHLLPKRKKYKKNEPTLGDLAFKQCPIQGIEYNREKKKLFAIDFILRYFDINLETGEPMSFKAERF